MALSGASCRALAVTKSDKLKLSNRLGLITGGGRGIGRAIARAFAEEGAEIAVAARTLAQVESVAQEISTQFSVKALPVVCDDAGIAESAPLTKTDDELWHRHLAINLSGSFYCTRAALPAMMAGSWGRIINIASIAGKTGAPYIAAYAASKHGLLGLTRSTALEVAAKGITANAICSGYVDTEMTTRGVENITKKTGRSAGEAMAAIRKMSPQDRLVTVEEVAALALLLASEAGGAINGQAINVDGGSVLF